MSASVKIWLVAILAILAFAAPARAQEARIVPFSKPNGAHMSVQLVCQRDGRIGTFVQLPKLPQSTDRAAYVFSFVSIVRNVDFFEASDQSVIFFPPTWNFTDVPGAMSGFFIMAANLNLKANPRFIGRVRSVTNDSLVYILQFLSSRYVGVELNGQRHLLEISLDEVSNGAVADCLRFAGYEQALAAIQAELRGTVEKEDLKRLCLETFGYVRALDDYKQMLKGVAGKGLPPLALPVETRADCFSTTEKDKPQLVAAFINAAERGLGLDYVGFGASARAADIPTPTLLLLKKEWGGAGLPDVVKAERAREREDVERRLKYAYFLYARIKSCDEGFDARKTRPFSKGELDKYRNTMSELASLYAPQFSADALWGEASADYPGMLSRLRYNIGVDANLASEGCSRSAGLFDGFAGKLIAQSAQPKKDF